MSERRFSAYAWGVLAFNIAVILWGAVVRATGSGAGCGSHWPRCDGALVPGLEDSATAIEFTHRLTSGLAALAVVWLFLAARRTFADRQAPARRAAAWALGFMAVEVAIGAALVLFGWTGDDTSTGRVVAIAVHLANTLLLLGALTLTAWWASGGRTVPPDYDRRAGRLLVAGLGALVVVAGIGAITALGDTLFPEATVADDFRRSSHYLVRLRVVHPVLAVLAGGYLVVLARLWRDRSPRWATAVAALVGVQIVAGVVNLALAAPLWLQIVHLLLADLLWIAAVLFGSEVLVAQADRRAEVEARA